MQYNIITIQKPTRFRIIISAIEVIESSLDVVIVASVSERVECSNSRIGMFIYFEYFTPSVVYVACDFSTAGSVDFKKF